MLSTNCVPSSTALSEAADQRGGVLAASALFARQVAHLIRNDSEALPAAPARALLAAALTPRMFVWSAVSSMVLMILLICAELSLILLIAATICDHLFIADVDIGACGSNHLIDIMRIVRCLHNLMRGFVDRRSQLPQQRLACSRSALRLTPAHCWKPAQSRWKPLGGIDLIWPSVSLRESRIWLTEVRIDAQSPSIPYRRKLSDRPAPSSKSRLVTSSIYSGKRLGNKAHAVQPASPSSSLVDT